MKKLFSMILAIAMVLSLSATVLAAPSNAPGTITVNNVKESTVLELYQILTYSYDTEAEDGKISAAEFTNTAYKGVFITAINEYVTADADKIALNASEYQILLHITNTRALQNDSFAKKLGEALEDYIKKNGIAANVISSTFENGSRTYTNVELGYYLILDKTDYGTVTENGQEVPAAISSVMLQPMDPNVVINLKTNEKPGIEKTADKSEYRIGQDVNYTIRIPIPYFELDGEGENKTLTAFKVTDILGIGLDAPTASSAYTVTLSGSAFTGYTMSEPREVVESDVDDTTIVTADIGATLIEFTFDTTNPEIAKLFKDAQGTDLVITYSATVNEDAAVNGLINKVRTNNAFGNPKYDDIIVYTYGFEVDKYDSDSYDEELGTGTIKLEGVKFKVFTIPEGAKLEDDDLVKTYLTFAPYAESSDYDYYHTGNAANADAATVLVTKADGSIKAWGLTTGTYYLEEVETNKKYNLLTEPWEFEITAKDGDNKIDLTKVGVANSIGIELPGTGGMGTAMFTILGTIIMAGAAFVLVINRKRIFNV